MGVGGILYAALHAKVEMRWVASKLSEIIWVPAFAGNADGGRLASLRDAKRRSNPGEYHLRSAPAPWVASLLSQ